ALSPLPETRMEAVAVHSTSLGRRRSRRDVKRTSEGRTTMSDKHQCRIESDGKSEFVVFNGARIATRDQLDTPQARTWVTLMPGYRRLLRAGFFVIRDPTSKICRTQIGWSPLQQGNVENAYSSIDSSFIAFARRNLAGINSSSQSPLALCKADAERICAGVAPGGGKIIACLKQHKDEVSVGCAKALKAMKTKKGT